MPRVFSPGIDGLKFFADLECQKELTPEKADPIGKTAGDPGGNSNIFWNFHPYLGKISNLTDIFQRG